jgi:DNA-binding LacI/PurR family transcriptional regulator
LAENLRQEIHAGQFTAGQPLPTPKDGSKLHGVHAATVRKAYGILQAQGMVDRQGRSWTVSLPHLKRTRTPTVLCIGAVGAGGKLRMESDREWDFWREIQMETIRCGLEPRLVTLDDALPELDARAFGAIVSNWHMSDTTRLLDNLHRLRMPSAVWVANEEALPGARYRSARTLWFHDLAQGREAGAIMAQYLAGLGHRKIAWISPFHKSSWSVNRLEGLKAALDGNIQVFEAVHDWISEWDVQTQIAGSPDTIRRVDLEGIDDDGDPDGLRRPIVETLTRMRCMEIFAPQLEAALACGATLWVAGSDLVARWCLHWLHAKGLRVPQDIALASFDDTREATRYNLTSLRFDVQGMARAMVRQVLSSRQEHKRLTRYAGHVVARGSTAGM